MEVDEGLNFCISCEEQTKCLKCGAYLFKGKSKCLACGQGVEGLPAPMNEYHLEEEITPNTSKRRIIARASDSAIGELAALFEIARERVLTAPTFPQTKARSGSSGGYVEVAPANRPAIQGSMDGTARTDRQQNEGPLDLSSLEKKSLAEQYFKPFDDEDLTPTHKLNLHLTNGATKKERQQVFVLLYVWALGLCLVKQVTREDIISALQREKLYDSNSTKYLKAVVKNYLRDTGGFLAMHTDGLTEVKRVIEGFDRGDQSDKDAAKKRSARTTRSPGQPSKQEREAVAAWLRKDLELGAFDVRNLKVAADWAAFTLYVLTKHLKVVTTVPAGLIYAYAFCQFQGMPVKRKGLTNALSRQESKFIRGTDGSYQLTQSAEQEVEKLLATAKQ
jgi:hypothetical protein